MKLLKTFTKENTWLKMMDCGWGNGYVAIPQGHKLHGVHYDNIDNISVHGGITFSELCNEELIEQWDLDKDLLGYWILGFDTAHYNDDKYNCSEKFVLSETEDFKAQIETLYP
jgi:hypothetical protein